MVKHFQEECEDVGNDVWNGRPSSSYTKENVDEYVPEWTIVTATFYIGMANRKGYINYIDQLIYCRVYVDMSDISGEIYPYI